MRHPRELNGGGAKTITIIRSMIVRGILSGVESLAGTRIPGGTVHLTIIIARTTSGTTLGGLLGPHTTVMYLMIHTLMDIIEDPLVVHHQSRHP